MSEQILFASDVNIKTTTIEVKVIKIGNRQVTLAVFRQLPEEPIIDPATGQMCGIPWGRVNYHSDCEHMSGVHFHVIWQKGSELRRAIAALPWRIDHSFLISPAYGELRDWVDNLAAAYIAQRILEGWVHDAQQLPSRFSFSLEDETIIALLDRELQHPWHFNYEGKMVIPTKDLKAHIPAACNGYSSEAIGQELLSNFRELKALKQTWQQSYERLEQLDQLFIAV